jgi:hypothetical protein
MFNQLQIPAHQIAAEVERAQTALAANLPQVDLARHAARVIAHRLRQYPEAYLEFGPYWWAVKDALRAAGEDFGSQDDPVVRPQYSPMLDTPGATLVAGELFKDYYRRTYLVGAAQFWLDDAAEESYVLFDADMEARRLGGGLRVAADMDAVRLPDDPENAY